MTARRPDAGGTSLLDPPSPCAAVRFPADFGQRVLLTVDTEEEFDWNGPFQRTGHTLHHLDQLPHFQSLCEDMGAHPVYLVDWPILEAAQARAVIGDAIGRGAADAGIQLHPWVNPPFDEQLSAANSFPGNLPPALEAAKFTALRNLFVQSFGHAPQIYRAGRYGVGPQTAAMLREAGVAIDTSVRALFDYSAAGGPDFSGHPLAPYWVDSAQSLIELPLTTTYWGILRQHGRHVHRLQRYIPTFFSAFSRLRLLERIALTPEGVSIEEAVRGIDMALDEGLPLLVLSLHSPSLAPGYTPYARDAAGVAAIHDWLRAVYAYLARRGVRSVSVGEVIAAAHPGHARQTGSS